MGRRGGRVDPSPGRGSGNACGVIGHGRERLRRERHRRPLDGKTDLTPPPDQTLPTSPTRSTRLTLRLARAEAIIGIGGPVAGLFNASELQ